MSFSAYILRCSDGSYYTGHTDNLELRMAQHSTGDITGYTATRQPVELMWAEHFPSRGEALAAELQIKGWSRGKKEALIRGDWPAIRRLSSRAHVLRDATPTSPGSAAASPQDERGGIQSVDSGTVRPEEGLSAVEVPSRRAKRPAPIIILVRPQLGENIGKAARAMLNFGVTQLRLVAPRDGWPNPDAGPAASGADIVLAQAKVFDTLAEAVADCSYLYATTVRRRELVMPVLRPDQAAAQIRASSGLSAIVFGPERSGLETDEVALANAILTVPVNPAFGSLNLAQAVILAVYEWSKGSDLAQPPVVDIAPPALQEQLDGMFDMLVEMLGAADYFRPPERKQATLRSLRTLLTKPGWSAKEVQMVRGILRAVSEGPRLRD